MRREHPAGSQPGQQRLQERIPAFRRNVLEDDVGIYPVELHCGRQSVDAFVHSHVGGPSGLRVLYREATHPQRDIHPRDSCADLRHW
jgi:hypothetical protein